MTRRPRHTRWVATRTSSATRAPHISWPPRELAQAVLVDAALSISAVLHATRRPCRGTDDRARQRDGARLRGGAPCSCTPLARASQSWKWRHVHARARPCTLPLLHSRRITCRPRSSGRGVDRRASVREPDGPGGSGWVRWRRASAAWHQKLSAEPEPAHSARSRPPGRSARAGTWRGLWP